MMRRTLIGVVVVIVILVIAYMVLVHKPAIDPVDEGQTFDAALIATGANLVAFGDCASCHTAPGGEPLAGGLPVPTPFGTIYSTNITPDRDTGIGAWSEAAFRRAMREGVDREGNFLYPAFPYDHFTHVTDEDDKAIYAYLMTRTPVSAEPPANDLSFPYNVRQIMAGWNLMFLKQGPLADDPDQSPEWNRGRYLAEGLGHCGACHTPRNSLGAEDSGQHFSGGPVIDGWYVYPINEKSPAPIKWNVASLSNYLRHGFAENHGTARGPMTQVTAQLASANGDDIKALATYVAAQMGVTEGDDAGGAPAPAVTQASTTPRPPLTSGDSLAVPAMAEAADDPGGAIYAAACSSCHESGRIQPYGGLDFHNSTAIHADNPQNIINMILYGLPATDSRKAGMMPGFAGALDQEQLVALLGYLRSNFTDKPAWPDVATQVADTMSGKTAVKTYSADGVIRSPGSVNARTAP